MPNISSWVPKGELEAVEAQCKVLNETVYLYVQKAVIERRKRNESLADKANRWLFEDR